MNSPILEELISHQLKDIPVDRMGYGDLLRLSKRLQSSIFNSDCVPFKVHQRSKKSKRLSYPVFFFNGERVALNRLLYKNFIGELISGEYLHCGCGHYNCLCLSHLEKHQSAHRRTDRPPTKKKKMKCRIDFDPQFLTITFD
jgi:hypothetical protein